MPGNLSPLPDEATRASWPTPDYVNPHGARTWFVPFGIVLLLVASFLVGMRFFLRITKRAGPFGLDDLLLVPAYLLSIPFTIFGILAVRSYGAGRHLYDVPPNDWVGLALMAWLAIFTYIICTACIKISVLLFFRRLSDGIVSPAWKYACLGAIWFTAVYAFTFMLLVVFNCNPTEAYWESYGADYNVPYHCIDTRAANIISGVIGNLGDAYSVLLPILMLRQFDAPRRQQIALTVVFSFGLLVIGASCVRTYYLWKLGTDWDTSWWSFDTLVWSTLEVHLAIMCASAPALHVFFQKFFDGSAKSSRRALESSGPYENFSAHGGPASRAIISYTSLNSSGSEHGHARDESYDDKSLGNFPTKTSLDPVDEYRPMAHAPPPPHAPAPAMTQTGPNTYPVKTPADFEAFALRELEKTRQSPYDAMLGQPHVVHPQHQQPSHLHPHPQQHAYPPQHVAAAAAAPGAPGFAQQPHPIYYDSMNKPLPIPDNTPPEVVLPSHQHLYHQHLQDANLKRTQSMKSTLSGPFEDPFTNPYPT